MADLSNRNIRFSRPLKRVTVNWCGAPAVPALEAQEAEKAALEKGRFEVREELSAQLTTFCDEVSQKQDSILKELQQSHQELLSEISDRLPRLVVKAAARVIEGLELDPAQVKDLIQKVLDEAPEGERVELRMNPQDLQLLKGIYEADVDKAQPDPSESNEDFSQALSGLFGGGGSDGLGEIYPDVEFIEDETLGRGDCMMESRYGLVDGRIATKLAAVEESMGGGDS